MSDIKFGDLLVSVIIVIKDIMKKIVQIMCVAVLIITIGCKPSNNTQAATGADKVDMTNKTADINQLYQFYYSNPQSLDERQENMLIDYIVDKDLAPTRSVTGLYYQITQEGTGERIRPGDQLEVHYSGKFLDGQIFDSSLQRNKPLKFKLGTTGLIQGWLEGLRYMKEGSKMILIVPSRLAYKGQGFGSLIGPDMALTFEMEVLKVN